jgi:hypothetical protein
MLTFERDAKSGRHVVEKHAGVCRDAKERTWNTGATEHENEFAIFAAGSNEKREKDAHKIILEQKNEPRDRAALSTRSRLFAVDP